MRETNVTEKELKLYAETFHKTLDETAQEFLPEEYRDSLLHISLLPAKVICYVSTQFGVAFEYLPSSLTSFETTRGSARIEFLVAHAPRRFGNLPTLVFIDGPNTAMFNGTLTDGFPFRLKNPSASVSIIDTDFKIGNWERSIKFAEVYGDRRSSTWAASSAIARAKNEVLAATVELWRADSRKISLSEYINIHKSKTVLVFGSYSEEGRKRLNLISGALRELGYDPITVEEIPDNPLQDLHQKATTLGSISRFVVVDDSEKSGHITEMGICIDQRWTTIVMHLGGIGSSWMTAGPSVYSKVINEISYDLSTLVKDLKRGVEWAEMCISETASSLSKIYPWRIDREK